MNAHRQHYFEANRLDRTERVDGRPWAAHQEDGEGDFAAPLAMGIALLLFALVSLHLVVKHLVQQEARADAHPAVSAPAQAIADARIEGFRAGVATATAEGCRQAALSMPIAPR